MLTPSEGAPGITAVAVGQAGVKTPPGGLEVPLRLVCISTDVQASVELQRTIAAILPQAHVEAADTSLVRSSPIADCVILAVGRLYSAGTALARELRARGYDGPIMLCVESPGGVAHADAARLGIDAVIAESDAALQLPEAMLRLLKGVALREGSPHAAAIHASLRRAQQLMAAGELVSGLQHRLNNPLAALLAEAQLLELEPLTPEHHASVRRMVELCRRVIEVSRSIKGIGHDLPPTG